MLSNERMMKFEFLSFSQEKLSNVRNPQQSEWHNYFKMFSKYVSTLRDTNFQGTLSKKGFFKMFHDILNKRNFTNLNFCHSLI